MAVDWVFAAQLDIPGLGWTVIDPEQISDAVGVTVERGVTEEGTIQPAKISWRINDPDDTWRPSNPRSPYYGLLTQYMRGAFGTGSSVRAVGEVAKFTADQTDDHQEDGSHTTVRGNRWVDVDVQGVLRRVGQWDDPLESALRHQISGYADLRGYWPLEDQRDSERLTNLTPNGRAGYHTGVTLAGAEGAAGSDRVLQLNTGGSFGGSFDTMPIDNTGWQVHIAFNGLAPDATERPIFQWYTSDGARWSWFQSSTTYRLQVIDREGSELYNNGSTHGAGAGPGQWLAFRWKVTRSGSTVTVESRWYRQDGEGLYFTSGTFTGPATRPTSWRVGQYANNDGAAYAHIFALYSDATNLLSSSFLNAFNGHARETTLARWQRLAGQAGLPWLLYGSTDDGTPMGPQPVATLIELFKEIAATEDGLIFDRMDNTGIALRGRRDMMNQTPALELTYPDNCRGMKEITDDLQLFNDVTVVNRNGGEARAVLETGPGSVDVAERVRKSVNVNVDEASVDLAQLAGYYLAKYTVSAPRFSEVIVDLEANPELHDTAKLVDIGDIITIAGRTPDLLRVRVLAIREKARLKRRVLEFVTEPADIWSGALYDDARADARGHQLDADAAAGVTTITVDYTTGDDADGLAWTHDDGDFDLIIAGEVVTVTAAAAPSGGTQDLTVTRAVNGVSKLLPAGAVVQLAEPDRYWR